MFESSRLAPCRIVIGFIFVNALTISTLAQSSSNQGTPAESRTGQSNVSTYARDKIETVNLANGNLSLSIPLAKIGGRGAASYTLALAYNSKVWTAQHNQESLGTDDTPEFPLTGVPRDLYTAVFDKPEEFEPGLAKLGGGWTIRLAPGLKALTFGIDPSTSKTCTVASEEPPKCGYNFVLTKMWLSLPDGSQVELRDKATQGTPAIAPVSNGFRQLIDRDRGRVWQSIDGSNVTFVRDAGYGVGQVGGIHFPSGWVFLPDGSRIRLVDGAGQKIIDRNGNFLSVGFGDFVDQLGRQTLLSFSENAVNITARGYLGMPDRVLTIQLGAIGDNLRASFQSLPRPFTTGDAYTDSQGNYSEHTLQVPHTDLFERSEGIKHYGTTDGEDIGARTTVTRLTLLDGRSFGFRYNQYGEVAEIVYPGGGLSQIDYAGSPSSICQLNSQMAATFNRRVSQRRTLTDAINVDAAWIYAYGGGVVNGESFPGTTVEAHQGSATGALLASESHYFLKLGLGSEYRTCFGNLGTGNEKWENAKEFHTVTQTGTGSTVTTRQWTQRAPLVWIDDGPSGYLRTRGQDQTSNDPRVAWEQTTLENGKVKRVEYRYDDFNNVTSIKEYGLGTAISPGALLRETVRTFAGSPSNLNINGYCYTNLDPLDSTCGNGLASDVGSIIHQRQVLLSESIKDVAGNQKAREDYEYDRYAGDSNHELVAPNTGMIMYDGGRFAVFNSVNEPRGNVTQVTRWAGTNNISSFSKYDKAGQVVWAKDANGNVATLSYNDNFGSGLNPEPGAGVQGPAGATFAMPTLSTNALGHQVRTQYDYSLGAAAGLKDPNGVITRTEYDSLGRPFRTTAALGLAEQAIVEMSYPTAFGNEARVSKQMDATRWLTTRTLFDGFDRVVTAASAEDGVHYQTAVFSIFSSTIYDALGRVKEKSNPSRNTTASTDGWTRYTYDLIGRVTEVATFAGAIDSPPPESGTNSSATGKVTTVYAGEVTTVTDQAGRTRRSAIDALGRIKEVYEAPDDPALNYLTSYDYDVLDNLVKVTQGPQSRYFMYDSLKRLQRARMPEQSLNSTLALLDSVTGNNQWSIAYVYDNNGNLIERTDARGVVSRYEYDPLDRNRTVDYSDTTGISPDLTRIYDGAGGGVGRLKESYAGGSEFVGANVEHTRIVNYDALGRVLEQRQRFKTNGIWSAEYKTQREYNLAGAVTLQIYPSGHTVSNAFDNAGRPNTFGGNLGDGTNRTYSTGMIYAATGGLTKEQFGTDTPIYNKLFYNSRGQLAEVRVSTGYSGPNDPSWNRGAILNQFSLQCSGVGCNATDNNGNVRRQDIFVPQNDQITSYKVWAQVYDYDALNRIARVKEYDSNNSQLWQQEYAYDRWGNRLTNNQANATWGLETNQTQVIIDASTNRMYAINDPFRSLVDYDAAGNQTRDYVTSSGTRAYDAENRMTSATANATTAVYAYSADGQRVRRKVNGVEIWQVYGIDSELLAEYAQNSPATTPRKEYGYRNGQLLVSAEPGGPVAPVFGDDFNDNSLDGSKWSQVVPGAPPTVTEQAQQLQIAPAPNVAGYNGIYSTSTHSLTGRMVQVEVSQVVSQAGWCENFLNLELNAQNYFLINTGSGSLVLRAMVNGVSDQTVFGYNGASHRHWRIRHDQSANTINFETSADGAVWIIRKTVTPGFALSALRFHLMAGAWGTGNGNPGTAKYDNFKLMDASAGSSSLAIANAGFEIPALGFGKFQYGPSGASWTFAGATGVSASGSGFTSGGTAPEGSQIAFVQGGTASVISQSVSGFQSGTNYSINFLSKQRTNCCNAGGQDIAVYLDNNLLGSFHPASNGFVEYSTATFTTTAGSHTIKFVGLNPLGGDHTAFIDRVRILGSRIEGAGVEWLVSDHLDTPRMVFDQSGALANVRRRDYLPFGEELIAGQGGRTTALGYAGDAIRQKFTAKERDIETGLDYFGARYYASTMGRFTSADPLLASAERSDPQTWNRYTYVTNNPLGFTDPTGERRNPVTGRRGINPVPANGTVGGIRSNRGNPHVGEWGMTRNGGARPHFGTDITAPIGTNLVAMESGTVTFADNSAGDGGRQVHVRMADGTVYKYFHLSAIPEGIARDVVVQEGQVIAVSGNSGNAAGLTANNEDHVHVSVTGPNGSINPVTWLNDPNAGVPVDVVTTTGTPPATPVTVPAGSANEQTITGPNGTVTVRQQPLPNGQPHEHPASVRPPPRRHPQ